MNKINAEKTKDMVIIGLMAAIICVMGPLSIRLPFTLVPISLTNLAIYFIMFLFRGRFDFLYYGKSVILPEFVYTMVITIFLYYILQKINQKLEISEKRRAKKFDL